MSAAAPQRPLAGRTLLLTRAADDNARWAARLVELGARVLERPCLRTAALPAAASGLRAALARARAQDGWLALTSRRAVEAVVELAPDAARGVRLACVSDATAERARGLLGPVELVAAAGTGAGLGALLSGAEGGAVVFACARGAGTGLEDALRAAGREVARVELYETLPAAPREPRERLAVDAALVASPSAARGLAATLALAPETTYVALGPTTGRALRELGCARVAEARARDLDGMLDALEAALTGKGTEGASAPGARGSR